MEVRKQLLNLYTNTMRFLAVSDVYHDFIAVLVLKCGVNEAFQNFESHFEQQVAKFNAHCTDSQIPDVRTA